MRAEVGTANAARVQGTVMLVARAAEVMEAAARAAG